MTLIAAKLSFVILLTAILTDAQNHPRIFTKDGSVHISSGDEGDIVFEPSQQGKVIVGGYELNVTHSVGPKGDKGEQGNDGNNGSRGSKGDKGVTGPPGAKGDIGESSYYTNVNSRSIICNSSSFGILRYFSSKLQLCTHKGWRYLAFEKSEASPCSFPNVPRTNLEAFYAADVGIMFQFNNDSSPTISSRTDFNVTADVSHVNSTLSYQDAVMRQAAWFSGNTYLNVSGIPDDFWRTSNWSVMALLKFGKVSPDGHGRQEIEVLGHGTAENYKGLHLGVTNQQVIHGYYSNDLKTGGLLFDKWYHITWSSEKDYQGKENRCVTINGMQHNCKENTGPRYQGSGDTTVGTWWHRTYDNNLILDNLIIVSGVVRYKASSNEEKQLCYARLVEKELP